MRGLRPRPLTRSSSSSHASDPTGLPVVSLRRSARAARCLAYDPMARLRQVTQGSVTTKFGYSGLDLIGEYNASGSLLRRYVHGPGMDNPIVWYEGTGTSDRRFLLGDERGSVIAVTNSTGGLIQANIYDEHGIPGTSNLGRATLPTP